MQLLIVYILLVVGGELIAVRIGFYLDTAMPSLSLPIVLGMFFAILLLMWPLAVYITERWLVPKSK
jgi:hypothetical protein